MNLPADYWEVTEKLDAHNVKVEVRDGKCELPECNEPTTNCGILRLRCCSREHIDVLLAMPERDRLALRSTESWHPTAAWMNEARRIAATLPDINAPTWSVPISDDEVPLSLPPVNRKVVTSRTTTTSVYFMACDDHAVVKIGYSKDPDARIADARRVSPCDLRSIGKVTGDVSTKRHWQREWESLRDHGDWFRFSDELRAAIEAVT